MKRLDRLNAILTQLQSKRVVTSAEIAERFNISQRTVYRDIRALEEAGIPICAEAGTGYSLMDHFHLPPVMFTNDEASALLLGEKLIEKMSDGQVRENYRSAACKIKAILRPQEKDFLEELHAKITVFGWSDWEKNGEQLYLNEIQQALVNCKILRIRYQAKHADEALVREIEPVGLCNYGGRWHLFAWCRLRQAYRDFRLDRLEELHVSEESYQKDKHPSMNELWQQLSPMNYEPNICIVISADRKKLVSESKYYYGFLNEEESENCVRMCFFNTDFHGFASWLIASRSLARVIEPAELATLHQSAMREISEAYQTTYPHCPDQKKDSKGFDK